MRNLLQIKTYSFRLLEKDAIDVEIFVKDYFIVNGLPLMHLTFLDEELILPMLKMHELSFKKLQRERAFRSKCPIGSHRQIPLDNNVSYDYLIACTVAMTNMHLATHLYPMW